MEAIVEVIDERDRLDLQEAVEELAAADRALTEAIGARERQRGAYLFVTRRIARAHDLTTRDQVDPQTGVIQRAVDGEAR